jgi:sugar-phosphatase
VSSAPPARTFRDARALLSDLDGTLLDSSGVIRRAWTAFAHRHGLDPDDVYRQVHGIPARESVRRLVPHADPVEEAAILHHAETSDTDGIVPLPGARELLGGPWPLAIVTSGTRDMAAIRIRAAGLPRPEVVITADDITRGKPDPECFELAAARLGVAPADCVVLEDAPAGIAAGRAAGARVIALRTTHEDAALAGADLIVDDIAALLRDGVV